MTELPQWLKDSLRCPRTGVPLVEEPADGGARLIARPEGGEPIRYEVDNGVPILLP